MAAPDPPLWAVAWRDPAAYARLETVGRSGIAWEWLRREPNYRLAAEAHHWPAAPALIRPEQPGAAAWGLHAFEDPGLCALAARPVWRSDRVPVLAAIARPDPAGGFDLGRHPSLAALVAGSRGSQHLLLSDGRAALRLDIVEGSLLDGPVGLEFRLFGLEGLEPRLALLRRLLRLEQSGLLGRPEGFSKARRQILLLRAHDALAAGATQRDIAAALLSPSSLPRRWRLEDPSLRLRAQRLVAGARAMAGGGWTSLLQAAGGVTLCE